MTRDEVEFVRKVAAYLATDDQDVVSFETQPMMDFAIDGVPPGYETTMVIKINDDSFLTVNIDWRNDGNAGAGNSD